MSLQLIRHPAEPVAPLAAGCVATIGAFDGLHLGHRQILARVQAEAAARQLPALVFSFEPTPKEYFSRGAPPARLMKFREKFLALEELGIDWFFCPRFQASLAGMTPDEFIDRLLLDLLHVRHLVVGDDFRFARQRSGSLADLQRRGAADGFSVEQVGSVICDGERVSSSVVRAALAAGDLAKARRLLGRGYRMAGMVVRGQQLGRELGMPTANVKLKRRQSPLEGIFAVRVGGLDASGERMPGSMRWPVSARGPR